MYMKEAVVNNQVGLHARPATFFIQKANEFKSSIWVEKDEQRVNAKSLLGVLSLGIIKGSTIIPITDVGNRMFAIGMPFARLFFEPQKTIVISSALLKPSRRAIKTLTTITIARRTQLTTTINSNDPQPTLCQIPLTTASLNAV